MSAAAMHVAESGEITDGAQGAGDEPREAGDFLPSEGEAARLIRAHDWAATPLGHPSQWSTSLRVVVRLMLANRFPHLLWWGPDYTQIYNDPYIPILGSKHPQQALGKPFRECWHEVFDILGPLVDKPFNGGPATWTEDIELIVRRHGFPEESHFIIAYSPVPDDSAPRGIGGVLATVHEITEKVVSERRVKILGDLGARVAEAKSEERACAQAIEVLAQHPKDVPFALLYLRDDAKRELRLVSTAGIAGAALLGQSPPVAQAPWPLATALETETLQLQTGLASVLPAVPPGPWPEPPDSAAVVPIKSHIPGQPVGALVVGISACLRPDERYLNFLELVGSLVATAIANARAYEHERRRAEALAEIDKVKTLFFSNVSHEFRTPLTLMLGPLEDALAVPKTPAKTCAHIEVAQHNARRLLKLVNSLLDFARIEAGRIQGQFAPLNLAALTTDLASTFRSAMQRAKLCFEVDCQPLGEPVYVDQQMWEKVVLNLLSNAFKFTMQGSVRVHMRREDGHAVLEVSDTGVGVPAEEIPHLFERFHRVHGTQARTHEGSGIGLALVYELVKLHGGSVEVTSRRGVGTRFRVRLAFGSAHLPAERIKAAAAAAPHSHAAEAQVYVQEALRWLPEAGGTEAPMAVQSREDAGPEPDSRFASTFGSRVLLADDNADMRSYVRGLLGPLYEVEAVGDGVQALDAARRRRPDLIVSDVMMPHLDGFELLKALRSDVGLNDVPVILLSARAGEESRIEGLRAGADDYIVKPFHARELLARIGATLELTALRRESEQRFRTYVNASSDVVYRMSPDWSEMRYLDGRNFIADQADPSHSWLDKYIPEEDRPRILAAIEAAIRAKSVFELEHRIIRADRSVGWTFSRAIPLLDDKGDILEWFGAASDVSERREAQEALERQQRQLEEDDRQKNEFLAMLAHELRNPLAPIRNAGELMARMFADNTQAQGVVEVVRRQVAHLSHLVDDLLDVSRITQRKIELRKETIEAAEVIRQAVETVESVIRERGHDLQIHSSYRSLPVHGDVSRLVQCVVNLLTNAAKYTEAGGRIHVTSRKQGQCAVIEVADNGMGIPPALITRVFDLFVQSERTLDRSQGGLGIGLSVVRRLVEMHGGSVHAESDGPGRGSTFSIHLPLTDPAAHKSVDCADIRVRPQRILVVDDNADAAVTLSMMLNLDGHETTTAYTARDALEKAESFQPSLILLDIGLPGMDGYEIARRVRALPSGASIRLVALTGYGQPEDRARALHEGFDAHLVKPMNPTELRKIIATASA
ncbi:MAG TPA: ATP-binding protein [Steroidobacteraceae bacterium]|nr:ATP-binding protein [Steroidobacteraceae bacterium]